MNTLFIINEFYSNAFNRKQMYLQKQNKILFDFHLNYFYKELDLLDVD